MTTCLDVPYKQCLIEFPNDPGGYTWHHRLLIFASGNNDGRWLAYTPGEELGVLNLTGKRVYPLVRGAAFPPDMVEYVYAFDDVTDQQLEGIVRRTRGYALIMGISAPFTGAAAGAGVWRLSDGARADFGSEVPGIALADEGTCVMRDRVGIVSVDDGWTTMELVAEDKVDEWKHTKSNGGAVDRRVLALTRDSDKRPYVDEASVVAKWQSPKIEHWPHEGPSVTMEYSTSSACAPPARPWCSTTYFDFLRKSGIPEKGGIAREYKAIIEAVRFFLSFDQLHMTALAGIEAMMRRLVAIEMAVSRSPKAPDWDSLDIVFSERHSEAGAAQTKSFLSWAASLQRDGAYVMKQGRLLREECGHARKRGQNDKKKGDDKAE